MAVRRRGGFVTSAGSFCKTCGRALESKRSPCSKGCAPPGEASPGGASRGEASPAGRSEATAPAFPAPEEASPAGGSEPTAPVFLAPEEVAVVAQRRRTMAEFLRRKVDHRQSVAVPGLRSPPAADSAAVAAKRSTLMFDMRRSCGALNHTAQAEEAKRRKELLQALEAAIALKELRLDPADGCWVYLAELQHRFSGEHANGELLGYWRDICSPLAGDSVEVGRAKFKLNAERRVDFFLSGTMMISDLVGLSILADSLLVAGTRAAHWDDEWMLSFASDHGAAAQRALALYRSAEDAEELRIDPSDGFRRTFNQLKAYLLEAYSERDILDYWNTDCNARYLEAKAAAEAIAAAESAGAPGDC